MVQRVAVKIMINRITVDRLRLLAYKLRRNNPAAVNISVAADHLEEASDEIERLTNELNQSVPLSVINDLLKKLEDGRNYWGCTPETNYKRVAEWLRKVIEPYKEKESADV